MQDIAIYGAGGFGREIACTIIRQNQIHSRWNFVGFFDDLKSIGEVNEYGKILGGIAEVNEWNNPLCIIIAIGNPQAVRHIYNQIKNEHISFPNLISDLSLADENNYSIGKGNIIQRGCRFSCNVHLGDFNILNGCITVGHDVKIDSFNVIMPDARISGEVQIGENNFIGVGAIILQRLKIGNDVKVGAGSVLMHNPKDGSLYMGNPAKIFKY